MFTGIITDVGTVEDARDGAAGRELRVRCAFDDLAPGESIALDGACLTVREHGPGWFVAAAVGTTLGRTTIGEWRAGRRVNLERALRADDRLGGHLVQGHVDCIGEVLSRRPEGQGARLALSLPPAIAPLVAEKGSIAIDGVSLTVASAGRERFEVALIPETLARTTLGAARPGTKVNLEADVLARHVARLRELSSGLDQDRLAGWGYGDGGK